MLRSLELEMSTSTAKVVFPFAGVGKSDNVPHDALDFTFSKNRSRLSLGEQKQGLLTATLYGTDVVAPDLTQSSVVV